MLCFLKLGFYVIDAATTPSPQSLQLTCPALASPPLAQGRDLLFGVGAGANINMAADETHVASGFTLFVFVFKDVVSELLYPGSCHVIRAPVGKQWLYGGEIDRNDEYDDEEQGGPSSCTYTASNGASIGTGTGTGIGTGHGAQNGAAQRPKPRLGFMPKGSDDAGAKQSQLAWLEHEELKTARAADSWA